jgi:cytochrome b subunit of formate dehydrogenase
MGHKNIPLPERRRLRSKMYKKHNLANILTHWFNVGMWLLLLPTGIAILSSPRLGLSPLWMQEMFRNVFGGTANLIRFHYTVGLLWIFVLVSISWLVSGATSYHSQPRACCSTRMISNG